MLAWYLSTLANLRASSSSMFYTFCSFSVPAWDQIFLAASNKCASPLFVDDIFTENWVKEPLNTPGFSLYFSVPPCWTTEIIPSLPSPNRYA